MPHGEGSVFPGAGVPGTGGGSSSGGESGTPSFAGFFESLTPETFTPIFARDPSIPVPPPTFTPTGIRTGTTLGTLPGTPGAPTFPTPGAPGTGSTPASLDPRILALQQLIAFLMQLFGGGGNGSSSAPAPATRTVIVQQPLPPPPVFLPPSGGGFPGGTVPNVSTIFSGIEQLIDFGIGTVVPALQQFGVLPTPPGPLSSVPQFPQPSVAQPVAFPGGAPVAQIPVMMNLGNLGIGAGPTSQLGPTPGAGACITPRVGTSMRLPSRVDVPVFDSAGNMRFTTFKNVGRPVLWTGDMAIAKRVKKIAGRARRASGGR